MKKFVLLLSIFALTAGITLAQNPVYYCWVDINQTSLEGNTVALEATYNAVDSLTGDTVVTDPSYTWSYGGMTFSGNNFTYTFDGPGEYEVCVSAVSSFGSAESCYTVVIGNNPDTTEFDVTLSYYFAYDSIECSGVVTPSITGGTAPYTYSWSTGATNEIIDGVCGNQTICLTVEDAASQVAEDCVTLGSNMPGDSCDMYLSYDITPASSGDIPDGDINITIYGGTEPYDVYWSDSSFNEDLVDVLPGEYTVQVSDAAGCSLTDSFYVPVGDSTGGDSTGTEFYVELDYYFAVPTNNCSAVVTSSITGGTAPYTYSWSTGSNIEQIDNVCAGEMVYLNVEDAMGEVADACITINDTMPDNSSDPWESNVDTCIITGIIDGAEITDVWVDGYELNALWEIIMGSDTVDIFINYGVITVTEPGVYEFVLYINCGNYKSVTTLSDDVYLDNSLLGVTAEKTTAISVYPNPFRDVLTIRTNQINYDVNIRLLDINGRILRHSIIPRGNENIRLTTGNLSSGLYFVRITYNGKQEVLKVVK